MDTQQNFNFYSQHLRGLDPAKGEQRVRCIFHDDENPSLSVNLVKGFWQCHAGCGGGGVNDFKKKLGISTNGTAQTIVAEYDYRDENGNLLFQTVRYQPKDFKQRRPDGNGGWVYNLNGTRRVVYRLPELLKSSGQVLTCEGEKDVDHLRRRGFTATTNPMGAGKWRKEYDEFLRGRDVVIIPDNDAPGRKHADRVANSLWGVARSIKIVSIPGLDEHGDVSDFFSRGHDESELRELIERTSALSECPDVPDDGKKKTDESRKLSVADRLCNYALDGSPSLFLDEHGQPHALVDGLPLPLTSRSHSWLRGMLWKNEKRSAASEALSQANGMLAAMAEEKGEIRELHLRSAWHGDALYVELKPKRIVLVASDGWRLIDAAPILFRQFRNSKPLPDPETGGDVGGLIGMLPLKTERDRRLFTAYLVLGFMPHIARPILSITGPHGSGKTTVHRVVKRMVDPTVPESVRLDPREFLQKCFHAFIVFVDNASFFPDWAVDTICRLITREGDSKRKLYSDDDDVIYELRRMVLVNSVNLPTNRPDYLDRAICIELDRITDDGRTTEREFWQRFEFEHGRWLGSIFTLISSAMKIHSGLRLSSLPRLADWGEYAAAVYEAQGWGVQTFFDDWQGNVKRQNRSVIDASSLVQILISFMDTRNEWSGTPTELLFDLRAKADELKIETKYDRRFPKTPDWLWRRIREVLPTLVASGINPSRDEQNDRIITIRKSC